MLTLQEPKRKPSSRPKRAAYCVANLNVPTSDCKLVIQTYLGALQQVVVMKRETGWSSLLDPVSRNRLQWIHIA